MPAPATLIPIVAAVRRRLEARRALESLDALLARLTPDPTRREAFRAALAAPGLSVIAEHKRASPSKGPLTDHGRDLAATVAAYRAGGAAALSILTEEDHFDGRLDDLVAASETSGLPCIRKDFVLDRSMIIEAALAGGSAVLLLACLHDAAALAELTSEAHAAGLAVLLEVHDEAELAAAAGAGADAIGVNARDLRTFEVDLATVERLLPKVPEGALRVAESGIHGPEDAARVRAAGADAILVGESLMRAEDPVAALAALRAAR